MVPERIRVPVKAPRRFSFVKKTCEQGGGGVLFVNLEVKLFMEDKPEKLLAEEQRLLGRKECR